MKKGLQRVTDDGREKKSENRNKQKRNNSFLLTVISEIHTRTAKYNSGIQHREEWRGRNINWNNKLATSCGSVFSPIWLIKVTDVGSFQILDMPYL